MSKKIKVDFDELIDLWAQLTVLCGILDENFPDEHFPNGRIKTAHQQSLEVYKIVDKWVTKDAEKNG